MRIESSRLGRVEVPDDRVIDLPDGLLGFPALTRFLLIDDQGESPFKWLQSVDEPSLAFIAIDPKQIMSDYLGGVLPLVKVRLQVSSPEELAVIVLVTIPDDPREMTANLKGPVVFNAEKRSGIQLVLDDERYPLRHRIFPESAKV